jgi:hypothetical protein
VHTGGHQFGLLHDVPSEIWLCVVLDGRPQSGRPSLTGIARAALDLAADELSDEVPDRDPEAVEAWPCIAAAILEPGIGEILSHVAEPRDEQTLQRLAALLAAPAAGVCDELVRRLGEAA